MDGFDNSFDEKEYDPQSSEELARWNPAELSGGFWREIEILYKTQKGNYFILFQGGLFSRFHADLNSNALPGSPLIKPITEQEAFAWCQETGNYDAIDRHFFLLKILS
jgi:hypothetical protein